ncbi:MAG TPA: hypothetical protein DCE12_08150 [Gammaproteobacteria bacterium]|nr:hypothetical protein [Gammaproteobacteria bacterium]HAF75291.1 hypothetical protein [Gammaproteobacteria bacterium]
MNVIARNLHRVFLIPQVLVLWFWAKKYRVKHFRAFVQDVLLIRRSGLFLLQYYSGVSRTPKPSVGTIRELRAISHFVSTGAQQGLDPNPLFSIRFYLDAYPDVGESGINPLIHYIQHGGKEGRSTHVLFDGAFFQRGSKEGINSSDTPLGDFLENGSSGDRNPCLLFDRRHYLSQKPDLTDYCGNPLIHYLKVGADSDFDPHPYFSSAYYRERYGAEIPDGTNVLEYFLSEGGHKGHHPSTRFNTSYYLEANPDIAKAGLIPLVHYLEIGFLERRFPTDQYSDWVRLQAVKEPSTKECAQLIEQFRVQPRFSVIVPVFNTDAVALRAMLGSVLDQVYPDWELCLANDASTEPQVRTILDEYQSRDSRIRVLHRSQTGHISAASNSALSLATGDFVALLDHDDLLDRFALFENARLINENPKAQIIYSDEDKINQRGLRYEPFMKPAWSPDLLLLQMYTGHLSVYKKELIDKVGGFREGYEGSQDYDLMLRASEMTQEIHHIPKVLYHWRTIEGSTAADPSAKEYAYVAGQKALQDAVRRRGIRARATRIPRSRQIGPPSDLNRRHDGSDSADILSGIYDTCFEKTSDMSMSVIVPCPESVDRSTRVASLLATILPQLEPPGVEVVLAVGGTQSFDLSRIKDQLYREFFSVTHSISAEKTRVSMDKRVKVKRFKDATNQISLINAGVEASRGKFLCFLDNSTSSVRYLGDKESGNWLSQMAAHAGREEIGAIGGLIVDCETRSVISSGIAVDGNGNVADLHRGESIESAGYFGRMLGASNCTAAKLGCLVTKKQIFEEIGGLDLDIPNCLSDLDYGLRLRKRGYRSVVLSQYRFFQSDRFTPIASDSTSVELSSSEKASFLEKWGSELSEYDPFYSPNLRFAGNCAKFQLDVELPEETLASS